MKDGLNPFDLSQFCDATNIYGDSGCDIMSSIPLKILIKGGTVVNAHHKEVADVYIEDGTIVAVQPNIKVIFEISRFGLSFLN